MNAESQDVRINQYGIDNSYSTDKQDFIRLGKGGVDDAEDGEVIVHEYGHAVHDAQVPGFGSSLDAGSIGEAFGDYLAVTVGLDAAQQYGWPVQAPAPCVADWDAVSYTSTTPHCLRRLDTGSGARGPEGRGALRRHDLERGALGHPAAVRRARARHSRLGPHAGRQPVRLRAGHHLPGRRARRRTTRRWRMTAAAAADAVRAGFAARHIYF